MPQLARCALPMIRPRASQASSESNYLRNESIVSDCYTFTAHQKAALAAFMCAATLLPIRAQALDIGFQGELLQEVTDNVEGVNPPDEDSGAVQTLVIGVYGEQRGTRVNAAFSGELDTRKTTSDDDSDLDTISRFLGAAEFKITPRSWTWYVGNVLGGVRTDNAIQPIDDNDLERRNVFVTGPAFEYERQGVSRTTARALYVNQSQNNESLEDIYSADVRHERDLRGGSFFGGRLGNIFTDATEEEVSEDDGQPEEDFNRATAAVFYNYQNGFFSLFSEIGATSFESDVESFDGLNAELRALQILGPQTSASVFINRDLNDQSLSTAQSLLENGDTAIGIAAAGTGFFTETRVGAQYSFQSNETTVNLLAGYAKLDFTAVGEDRDQGFASASWSNRLSLRLRSELGINYETQDFSDRADNSESVLARARLIYSLSQSFDLQFSVTHDTGTGILTRFNEGVGVGGAVGIVEQDIDVTENRVAIGLRWAPPSRASQDLTVELETLLQ